MIEQRDIQSAHAAQERLPACAREEQPVEQPRVLTLDEVKAVAGGPYIENRPS